MRFVSSWQISSTMLKISIFLLAVLVHCALSSNSTTDQPAGRPQNDLQKASPARGKSAAPTGRAGRMLDLDRMAGDVAKSSASTKEAASLSGNRQSRILSEDISTAGEVEERSKKGASKKMAIKGFIPIVSMEGAAQLSDLTGGNSDSEESEDNNEPQQQQGNLREHMSTSYGGQTSIGHASFPSGHQTAQSSGDQQWQQQVDALQQQQQQQPQIYSTAADQGQENARANRKLLGTSNIFNSLTSHQKRGLVSSLIAPGLSLGGGGGGGGYSSGYPGSYAQASHVQSQLLAGPMNPPHASTLLEQSADCICVPFFQCKNGYLSESQLSKSQLVQLSNLNPLANGGLQVPRSSLSASANTAQAPPNDLYYNLQQPQAQLGPIAQQQPQQLSLSAAGQLQDASQQQQQQQQQVMMNDIYEQLRKNMESGQLDQQMQSALIDERNAGRGANATSEGEERSLFNSLSNRRNYQTAARSCGIMRTCCKVPPARMGHSQHHQQVARFVQPQQQQLIASPSVGRPHVTSGQFASQQLAHRYLQTRPPRMSNQVQASDFYPSQQQQQQQQLGANLDAYQQQAAAQLGQPMVMESIMQQQQLQQQLQQQQHQQLQPAQQQLAPLVSRPPPGSFMQGRCGIRQTLGISGRVQNAPASQSGLEPGESTADFGEFPAHAAILKRISPGDSLFVCSAVLISGQWLATAAHCVRKHRPEELKVRLGEWDVNRDDEFYPYVETNVREIVLNPDFQPTSLANDLALLRLESAVDQAQMPHVAPACLAQPEEQAAYAGQRCWVAGWGKNAFGQQGTFQSVLKKVDLPVVSHADCELALKYQTKLGKFFRLHANNICAGGERGKDACEGDGGAGLYCLDPQSQLIKAVGLVSWGVGCGQRGVPGVYVNLANFNGWIESVVAASGEENVYLDARMNEAQASNFKNIISERTNDHKQQAAVANATLQTFYDHNQGRSMAGANETTLALTTTTTSTTTTTTAAPKL